MGNRCYLETENNQLAESNNILPVFWLLGFDEDILTTIKEQVQYLFTDKEYVDSDLPKIEIKITSYYSNLLEHTEYIKKLYPEYLDMFLDFQYLINNEKIFSKMIYLNIFEFYSFFDNEQDITLTFEQLFEAIKTNNKTKFIEGDYPLDTTIGFDYWTNYYDISIYDNYKMYFYPKNKITTNIILDNKQKESSIVLIYLNLIGTVVLIFVSIIFMLFSIFFLFYKRENILLFSLSLILFGSYLLFFAKKELSKALNNIKQKKK